MQESTHNEQGAFMEHYKKIAAQSEKVKAEQKEYRRLRKEAKADGIMLRDMDFAMRCADIDDGNIIVEDMQRQIQIAAWFNLPIDSQANLFPEDYDPDAAEPDLGDVE